MSKSRDIGDSAATINFIDNLTSDAQTQLNTLTTNVATNATAISNINVTSGSQTKTYSAGETSTITLSGNVLSPIIGVTKEVAQTGVSNNAWDVNSSSENYTRYNSAAATTLDFNSYAIGTASHTTQFSISSQESNAQGMAFNSDGTKMFVTGTAGDDVNEYALSTGFDVSTASYTQNFSVSSQTNTPRDVTFNPAGTEMFVVDGNAGGVLQYTLTTGFDVSTASYTRNKNTSSQDTDPKGVAFNTDGTKMFVVGNQDDRIYEYSVSTGFDLSSVSYTTSYQFSSQNTNPGGLQFNSDGTKFFMANASNVKVHEYSLSTGFDLSSTVAFVQSLAVDSQESEPRGLAFNADGTKLFIVGEGGDEVNEYALTPDTFILGSGSFASADVGKTIEANSGVFRLKATAGTFETVTSPSSFNQVASGSWKMYAVVFNTTDGDLELSSFSDVYNFGAQTQLSNNVTYSGASGYSGATHPVAIHWGEGSKTRMVTTVDMDSDQLLTWQATAANDLSSLAKQDSLSISGQMSSPTGFCWADSGNKAYICDSNNIYQYTITSSYQASGSYASKSLTGLANMSGVLVSDDGTQIYACKSNGSGLYHYTMSTAFDLSSANVASGGHFSLPSQSGLDDWADMVYQDNGNKLFIIDTGREMFEYNLSTAYRIETASFVQKLNISTPGDIKGFDIRANGSRFYAVGSAARLYEFSIGAGVVIPSGYHAAHTTTSTDSTYWTDINSMTADEAAGDGAIYYCVSTDDRTTWKIAKGTDGERSIVRNNSGTWQYNSNGTYGSTTWANATTNAELAAIQEAMTGATGTTNTFDVSTASFVDSFSVSSQESDPCGLAFNTNGTKMFVCGVSGDDVNEYTLSTGFDVSTASFVDSFSVSSQATQPRGIAFNADGTKMFVVSDTTGARFVYQYNLSTGFDVSSSSYSNYSLNVSSQDTSPQDIAFNTDGTKMFIAGNSSNRVLEYTLSTGFDLNSTVTFIDGFELSSQESEIHGVTFNNDGTKMFIVGTNGDEVNQFPLSTAFDVSTASQSVTTFSLASQDTQPTSIRFNSDGSKMFVLGLSGQDVNEYNIGTTSYTNQMNKTQLDAIPDANHFTLANDLDLAIIFNLSSGSTVPSSDGVAINYDANVLNQGAILGTDYTYDTPAQNKVRITSTNSANLKIRIV